MEQVAVVEEANVAAAALNLPKGSTSFKALAALVQADIAKEAVPQSLSESLRAVPRVRYFWAVRHTTHHARTGKGAPCDGCRESGVVGWMQVAHALMVCCAQVGWRVPTGEHLAAIRGGA